MMARRPTHEVEQEVEPTVEEDQPEQQVHGPFALTGAQVGTTIDSNGTITQILYTGSPTSYEQPQFDPGTGLPTSGYFCLVDTGVIPSKAIVLYNISPHTNGGHSPHATHKMMGNSNGIPFKTLVLQSMPAGATFSITTA